MNTFDPFMFARTKDDFQADIHTSLRAIVDFARAQEYDWMQLVSESRGYVAIRVGVLDVYFREAYGLDRQGYIQFGFRERRIDSTIRSIVVDEWRFNGNSSYRDHLETPDGIRLVIAACERTLEAISERYGPATRCVGGVVLAPESLQALADPNARLP